MDFAYSFVAENPISGDEDVEMFDARLEKKWYQVDLRDYDAFRRLEIREKNRLKERFQQWK